MRSKSFIAVAAGLVLLLVLAGAVYAYDQSRSDRIAEGVTVSGVDVGGLSREAAAAKLRRELLDPLDRPVVASARGHRFTLTPESAKVGVDVDGSIDAALRASRAGNPISRAFRDLTGGTVQRAVDVDVTYARASVERLVARVAEKIERDPVDASLDLEHGSLDPVPAKDGLRIKERRLARDVRAALVNPRGSREVRVQTATVAPEVETSELAAKYPRIIKVDRSRFRLTLYKGLKPAKTYRIAVGRVGLETPAGLYDVANKAVNPAWNVPDSDWAGDLAGKVIPPGDPRNPIAARWMGIYDGAGIHGTTEDWSIGTAASHGCIRMRIPDVIDLYDRVEIGDPVYIA